jgi:hypothetical protein
MYPQYNNNKKNLDLFTILRSYDLKMQNKKIENFKKKTSYFTIQCLMLYAYTFLAEYQRDYQSTISRHASYIYRSISLYIYLNIVLGKSISYSFFKNYDSRISYTILSDGHMITQLIRNSRFISGARSCDVMGVGREGKTRSATVAFQKKFSFLGTSYLN